jgi:hypothetical protein
MFACIINDILTFDVLWFLMLHAVYCLIETNRLCQFVSSFEAVLFNDLNEITNITWLYAPFVTSFLTTRSLDEGTLWFVQETLNGTWKQGTTMWYVAVRFSQLGPRG